MRVAVCQLASSLDPMANGKLIAAAIAEVAEDRPDLIVLPEAMMCDFGGATRDLVVVAEPIDGPFVETLSTAAAASGAVVVGGMFERRTDGASQLPYNTVVAVSPGGDLLARYRKLHLYDAFSYAESKRLSAGTDDPPVFGLAGLRVGIMTCYDLRFPEVARLLVDDGADVLVIPAAWAVGEHKVQHWRGLLAARAIENTAYVVGAGQHGPRYAANSAILDPMGMTLASAGAGAQTIVAEIEAARVEEVRADNPSLANRRFRAVRR